MVHVGGKGERVLVLNDSHLRQMLLRPLGSSICANIVNQEQLTRGLRLDRKNRGQISFYLPAVIVADHSYG